MGGAERREDGVYAVGAGGEEQLVHRYEGGDYSLADVAGLFGLGTLEDEGDGDEFALLLSRKQARELKAMADAYSFDHEPDFIRMCYDMHRFAADMDGDALRFVGNF